MTLPALTIETIFSRQRESDGPLASCQPAGTVAGASAEVRGDSEELNKWQRLCSSCPAEEVKS